MFSKIKYIKALSDNVLTDNLDDSSGRMSEAHNNILFIGSADVFANLRRFAYYIGPCNRGEFTQGEHALLLTELIKSVRIDLYKNKKINDGYPVVGMYGKNKSG